MRKSSASVPWLVRPYELRLIGQSITCKINRENGKGRKSGEEWEGGTLLDDSFSYSGNGFRKKDLICRFCHRYIGPNDQYLHLPYEFFILEENMSFHRPKHISYSANKIDIMIVLHTIGWNSVGLLRSKHINTQIVSRLYLDLFINKLFILLFNKFELT